MVWAVVWSGQSGQQLQQVLVDQVGSLVGGGRPTTVRVGHVIGGVGRWSAGGDPGDQVTGPEPAPRRRDGAAELAEGEDPGVARGRLVEEPGALPGRHGQHQIDGGEILRGDPGAEDPGRVTAAGDELSGHRAVHRPGRQPVGPGAREARHPAAPHQGAAAALGVGGAADVGRADVQHGERPREGPPRDGRQDGCRAGVDRPTASGCRATTGR
ncbi:hypothetical protein SDC9_104207 [bioreactor metagenome]|uniref:Uncharacterized protein n=1 Tax=bioreactor metagenome TaxID=1076179 RepID=A0A645AVW3_9ZZZZ